MTYELPRWDKRILRALWVRIRRWGKIHFWRVCVRELDLSVSALPQPPKGFEYEVLDDSGIRTLADTSDMVSPEFAERAISQSDTCLVVRKNGQLMGFSWRTRYALEFTPGQLMKLTQPNTFYGFKAWIDPEARGLRLFEHMRQYLDVLVVADGFNMAIGYINIDNLASWSSFRREPLCRQVGWSVHASWGAASWTYSTPLAREWIVSQRE